MKTQTFLPENVRCGRRLSVFLLTFAAMNAPIQYHTVSFRPSAAGRGSVATVGMFDGVHRGHQFVVAQVCRRAHELGLAAAVVTFGRPPRQVLQPGWHPRLLCTPDEKLRLLGQAGADCCHVLHFDRATAALPARRFMQWLHTDLGVELLLTGYDNRFGHGRDETFADYARYGRELGMGVECLPPAPAVAGLPAVSSSLVRQLLADGLAEEAARALGRRYSIEGTVVRGQHIGTGLGFPTANLQPACADQLIPAAGAYAVTASAEGIDEPLRGMMNIGTRPTFGPHAVTIEVHLFHFHHDIYGRRLRVELAARLRGEQRFSSPQALALQLRADAAAAENILNNQQP